MMLLFAVLVFSQTVSADGSQKIFELAEQTYKQSADIVLGGADKEASKTVQEPVEGTFINNEGNK